MSVTAEKEVEIASPLPQGGRKFWQSQTYPSCRGPSWPHGYSSLGQERQKTSLQKASGTTQNKTLCTAPSTMLSQVAWLKLLRQLPWLAFWTRECQLLHLLERQKTTRQLVSGQGNLSVALQFTKLVIIRGRSTVRIKQDDECRFQALFSYQPDQEF